MLVPFSRQVVNYLLKVTIPLQAEKSVIRQLPGKVIGQMSYMLPGAQTSSASSNRPEKILDARGVSLALHNDHESHHVFTTIHHVLTSQTPSKTGKFFSK
jgi:hypothetical protein